MLGMFLAPRRLPGRSPGALELISPWPDCSKSTIRSAAPVVILALH